MSVELNPDCAKSAKYYVSESRWIERFSLESMATLDLANISHAFVVSPHPDDESLGVGGIISYLAKDGVDVTLVSVTNGEAAFPKLPLSERRKLASLRLAERGDAMGALGASSIELVNLGYPDSKVSDHQNELRNQLMSRFQLGHQPPGAAPKGRGRVVCFTTWVHDGHPDHRATAIATAEACLLTSVELYQFPIWTWVHKAPNDPQIPWEDLQIFHLDDALVARKHEAIHQYRSQIAPWNDQEPSILDREMLSHFAREFEVVITQRTQGVD